MSSTNKTTNLNLNSWVSTDKPKMQDFIYDNNIIDSVVSTHIADTNSHLTSALLAKINTPFTCSNYIGNGNSSRTISLTFAPKFVIVFCCSMPFNMYDSESEYTEITSAFLASSNSDPYSSPGGYISGNGFIVYQMPDGQDQQGMHYSLNLSGESYAYIAFK